MDQPELGLPGREYFINPGDYQYREAYLDLMLNVAQMLGASLPAAVKDMTEVLHFETHLSRVGVPCGWVPFHSAAPHAAWSSYFRMPFPRGRPPPLGLNKA